MTSTTLVAGRMFSQYRLDQQIGAGGMGVVWKAEDTVLRRTVAIKFLPATLMQDEESREMFLNEARLASSLSESGIAQVYEFGHEAEFGFLVMEYVDGQPLTRRLEGRPLAPLQVARLGYQVAHALAKAHGRGLIHRDLKPANILVTEAGEVKVIDFGLATLIAKSIPADKHEATTMVRLSTASGADAEPETTQTVSGTPSYMSPEQVRGEMLDARSDIFSLGIVLYQMTTGTLPFRGETALELMREVQRAQPRPAHDLVPSVPQDLDRIIRKALSPSVDDRYQTMDDVAVDLRQLGREIESGSSPSFEALRGGAAVPNTRTRMASPKGMRRWKLAAAALVAAAILAAAYLRIGPQQTGESLATGHPPATTDRKRIVVLPFKNLGSAEDEYFASGISEEITTRLAAVSGLGVISRKSAIHYTNSDKTIAEIGDELRVGYVLEGTVRWARGSGGASRVRITPQLIRVDDDTHIWADTYDRTIEDIFEVQSEIAGRVIDQLGVTLLASERQAIGSRPTANLEAYQAYLRGIDYAARADKSEESLALTVQSFERAVALDPGFALAWARLSESQGELYHRAYDKSEDRREKTKAALDRAVDLAPDIPEVHRAAGLYVYRVHRDYDRALTEYALAGRGLPNDAELLALRAFIHRRQGRWTETIALMEKAVELNPRHTANINDLCNTYLVVRRYEDAIHCYDLAVGMAPDEIDPYLSKSEAYLQWRGTTGEARAILESIPPNSDERVQIIWFYQEIYERKYEAAVQRLTLFPSRTIMNDPKELYLGLAYALLGRHELAREAFDVARINLEEQVRESPEAEWIHQSLGLAYAGLGLKNEAIREATRAVEIVPMLKDAYSGPVQLMLLAEIYTMVGEHDAALDQIEYLLSIPSFISVPMLRLDPAWDPLRDHPRFRRLVEQPASSSPRS